MTLSVHVFGTTFQNPVLLAAGTCGFGLELADVVDLEALGGLVTKSVTLEARYGNPPPRVAEVGAGMLNSIGLANPGLEAVKRDKLPWLRDHVGRARVLVSVAGHRPEEYERLVEALDGEAGFLGFELNLSCPNDLRLGGRPFSLDRDALVDVVRRCRARTERPLLVKLAPNDPDLADTVRAAEAAGADGLTLVNTLPGLAFRHGSGRPALGAGAGGLSGPALRPVAVRAVATARDATDLPLVGVGGVANAEDAMEYFRAGASLVQVGTATFAAPRAAEGVVAGLGEAFRRAGLGGPGEVETAGVVGRSAASVGRGTPSAVGAGPD